MKRRLTDSLVHDVASSIMDSEVPGFAVRVGPQGKKTFVLVSRFGTKNPTRRALFSRKRGIASQKLRPSAGVSRKVIAPQARAFGCDLEIKTPGLCPKTLGWGSG